VSSTSRLAATFAVQSRACESLGSPLYASLLRRCVADIEGGGPVAVVLRGHENDPGPSGLALRLLGAVHRLVLDGEVTQLAAHYPSVGGDGDAEAAWSALKAALTEHSARIRPLLDAAPQTNEVGRAAGLLGGLLHLAAQFALPIELHEIGSSAGLNLRADAYCYRDAGGGHLWGPAGSPVQLLDAWRGPLPPVTAPLEVIRRLGSDVAPLDPANHDDATTLQSYVWADMTPRLERLRAALSVAVQQPTPVDQLDAIEAVQRLQPVRGRVVVLWHSVMWQYVARDAQAAVTARLAELGARADGQAPLAHLFLEPTRREPGAEHEFLLVLQTWPGTRRILACAPGHGLPVSWETPTLLW
jgi:hypothetical protein